MRLFTMRDEDKTKEQLLLELRELHQRITVLENPVFKNEICKTEELEIKKNQTLFKNIIDGSPVPQFVIDQRHQIIHWNQALEEYSGIKEIEVIGTNQQWRAFYSEERPCLADLLVEGATDQIEDWYSGKYSHSKLVEGAFEATDFFPDMLGGVWLYFTAATIRDDFGNVTGAVETLTDVTERKNAELALQKSEAKYRSVVENIQDVFYRSDNHGNLIMASPSFIQLLGYSMEECLNKPIAETFYLNPEDRLEFLRELKEKGSLKNYEVVLKRKDGSQVVVETSSNYYYDENGNMLGIEGIFRDITERKEAEKQLKNSLREKEILLTEIHHRVKNNMQIIYSLLSLQSEYIADKKYKALFIENQNRVKSMAGVHEKLYLSSDFSNINFREYIQDLIAELFISYSIDLNRIKVILNVQKILIGMDTAIPCGLILNELITNSIKHAFNECEGEIKIDFYLEKGSYILICSDNGVGFPEDIDFKETTTLGMQLVRSLVKQLDGIIELYRGNGTKFTIKFKELKYKERLM
jgi:PAS domain S-box-containing protein